MRISISSPEGLRYGRIDSTPTDVAQPFRAALFASLILLGLGSDASAQPARDARWTFGGTAGLARTWDDEGSIGSGWTAGGYVERRLSKHVGVEFAADLVKNDRRDAFEADGRTTYVSAQLIRRFGNRTANFFLMGGGALAFYEGTTGFSDGSFRSEHSSTNPGWMFGGGLSFRTASDIEIAPIVRLTLMQIDSDSDPWSAIIGGVRIGFSR